MNLKRGLLMEEAGVESTTSGSTASSTPAAAPVAAPVVEAPAPAAEVSNASTETPSDVDWVAESELGDENERQTPAVAAPAPAAAKPAPVVAPAAAAPAVAAPAAPVEAPKPAAAPAAAAPAAPATPAPQVAETPEAKTARETAEAAEETKQFKALVDYYKLPEDLVAKLPTEPELVLPHLAATLHKTIARQVVQLFQSQIPQYLHHHGEVTRLNNEAKDEFYKANSHLVGYEQQVLQAGRLYRELNPTADRATSIKAIGKIVTDSLGLTPAGTPAAAPKPAAAPGFTPAGASGSRGPAPAATGNEFETMSLDD